MPIKGKTKEAKVHAEAKHLKEKKVGGKKPWHRLSWKALHGVAQKIVTGKNKRK